MNSQVTQHRHDTIEYYYGVIDLMFLEFLREYKDMTRSLK
jgi:hypothetical protein